MSTHTITLKLNGEEHTREVEARLLLVHLIREDLMPADVAVTDAPPEHVQLLAAEISEYFVGGAWPPPRELVDKAGVSPFLAQVYRVVSEIPPGETMTYGEVASAIGRPGAARAVGRAMATNPFPVLIPCHRVVGSDGSLRGFGGGLEMKEHMLRMEAP